METCQLRVGDVVRCLRTTPSFLLVDERGVDDDRALSGVEAGVCLVVSVPRVGNVSISFMDKNAYSYYVMSLLVLSPAHGLCLYTTGQDGIDDSWQIVP